MATSVERSLAQALALALGYTCIINSNSNGRHFHLWAVWTAWTVRTDTEDVSTVQVYYFISILLPAAIVAFSSCLFM